MKSCDSDSASSGPWEAPAASRPAEARPLLGRLAALVRSWLDAGPAAGTFDHAVAAVLVHAATLREPATSVRQRRVQALLAAYFSLEPDGAAALAAAARREDDEAVDLHRFARIINRRLAQEDRQRVFAMAAEVVFAGEPGAAGEGFLRLLGGLLGSPDHDRGALQHRIHESAAARRLSTSHSEAE